VAWRQADSSLGLPFSYSRNRRETTAIAATRPGEARKGGARGIFKRDIS